MILKNLKEQKVTSPAKVETCLHGTISTDFFCSLKEISEVMNESFKDLENGGQIDE